VAVTKAISFDGAENLREGAAFATRIGKPLTQFITIHWFKADGSENADRRFARLRECAQKWLVRKGVPLTCCWVLEAPKQNVHSHMAIHLPPDLVESFSAMLSTWVGGNDVPGMIDVKPATTLGWRRYLLKGVGPAGWDKFNIPHRHRVPQGKIKGKRSGTSQNLGPAARKRWNDRMIRHLEDQKAA
jgi:hypothetical protein